MRKLIEAIPVPDGRADRWQGINLPPTYHELTPVAGPCWFVDGGNAEILGAPHFSLQKMRAVALRLPEKKLIRREETVLVRKAPVGWEIIRENQKAVFTPVQELAEVLTATRQELEHAVALEAQQTGELVVLDGDVAPHGCIALQKTSTILTENNFPLTSVLVHEGTWYAPLGKLHAVKLDARARHIFLVAGATPSQLAILSHYSIDAAFPGYPWGLVLADRLARVSHEEAHALRIHAKSLLKELGAAVEQAQASVDSHSILDSMG